MGTGSFIQKEWTKKQRSVFTKNPDYFESGLPYVDQVELYVQDDANALRAGSKTYNYFDYNAPDKKRWRTRSPRTATTWSPRRRPCRVVRTSTAGSTR